MQILWYKFNIIGKYFKYRLTLTHVCYTYALWLFALSLRIHNIYAVLLWAKHTLQLFLH